MPRPNPATLLRHKNRIVKTKAGLEVSFKAIFKNWQKRVFQSFVAQVRDRIQSPSIPTDLKENLNILLTDHYHNVSEKFVPGLRSTEIKRAISGIPLDGSDPEDEEDDVDFMIPELLRNIENSLDDQIFNTQPVHFDSIIRTTELAGTRANSLSVSEGIAYGAVLGKLLSSHTTTVSITETDWIAEASMQTALDLSTPLTAIANKKQLEVLQKISPNITLKEADLDDLFEEESFALLSESRRLWALPTKTWITVGDRRVRKSHQLANGQTVPVNQPFILPGGLLMFPADSSLGVDFSEIVNCRCTALYY